MANLHTLGFADSDGPEIGGSIVSANESVLGGTRSCSTSFSSSSKRTFELDALDGTAGNFALAFALLFAVLLFVIMNAESGDSRWISLKLAYIPSLTLGSKS